MIATRRNVSVLVLCLAATGCGDAVSVRGTLMRQGTPVGPAPGESIKVVLEGKLYQHEFNVEPDGTFGLTSDSSPLPPGSYKARVQWVKSPEPQPQKNADPNVPSPPASIRTYAVPGEVVVEAGKSSGYTIEVP